MTRKKTDAEFKAEVKALVGDEYILVSEYKKNKSKIYILHLKCGNLFQMRPDHFINGERCPYCSYYRAGKKKRMSEKRFKCEVQKLGNGNYKPLSRYHGNKAKIIMLHKTCGKKYFVRPNDFICGQRCPFCQREVRAVKQRTPFKKISQRVAQIGNGEYEIIKQNYKNTNSKATFYHKVCKNFFKMKFNSFANGQRCPFCKSSKGEKAVKKIS